MRKEVVEPLDLKNARARARWVLRYFSGQVFGDERSSVERSQFEAWYSPRLEAARAYLGGAHGY
jgi:hypothetical protein